MDNDTSNRALNFISQNRQLNSIVPDDRTNAFSFDKLGEKQRKAYDIIIQHYKGANSEPLHMIIQGPAGTGKSYLIGAIKQAFEVDYFPEKSPLLLLASTRVATFNISASTLHSALHIPVKDMTSLDGSRLINLQEEM